MKSILLFLFLFCFSSTLQAQFNVLQTSTNENLNDVHFIDSQIGFAVGENGAIVKTIDGGNTWSTLSLNTTERLSKVQFLDANIGFVLSDTTLFKTVDGGNNFTSQTFSEQLRDFHFISPSEGKIASYKNGSVVLSTIDGGNNFTSQVLDQSWYSWDSLQGIGVGNYYTLHCIDYKNGQWEVGGSDYDYNGGDYPYALYSTNGTQWSTRYLSLNLLYGDTDAAIIDVKTNNQGDVFHLKKPDSDKTYLYQNEWGQLSNFSGQYYNKMNECDLLNDSTLMMPINGNLRIYHVNGSEEEKVINLIVLTGGIGVVNNSIAFFTGENGKLAKYTDLTSSVSSTLSLDFRIFPNPSEDFLIIETEEKDVNIEILDANGRILLKGFSILNTKIDISKLSSGLYFVKLTNGKSNTIKKFIKK